MWDEKAMGKACGKCASCCWGNKGFRRIELALLGDLKARKNRMQVKFSFDKTKSKQ
jgi:hypothetical protein